MTLICRFSGGAALLGILLLASGCLSIPALPDALDVALSATEQRSAPAGSGPVVLAGSVWGLARTGDPNEPDDAPPPGPYGGLLSGRGLARPPVGERIFQVHFDRSGAMTEVTDNRFFLPEFYGDTVPVGVDWSATTLPGVRFRSASYGVQEGDRFGLAVLVQVRLGEVYVGQAILYSWGSVSGATLTGQFGYLLDFSGGLLALLGQVADQYPIDGTRVEP